MKHPTETQGIIELRDVDFTSGAAPVLSDIDLQVCDGEFLGVVGW